MYVGSYMYMSSPERGTWCEGSKLRGVHHVREVARQIV